MCGIVGLFLKGLSLEPRLGELLTEMLITMADLGPDSAAIAVHGEDHEGLARMALQAADPASLKGLDGELSKAIGAAVSERLKDTHAVLEMPEDRIEEARAALRRLRPDVRVMSAGEAIDMYADGHKVRGAPKLPLNMLDAMRAYDRDKELKKMMGEDFSSAYLRMKQKEWDSFVSHFSNWEKEHTLNI